MKNVLCRFPLEQEVEEELFAYVRIGYVRLLFYFDKIDPNALPLNVGTFGLPAAALLGEGS